MKIRLWGNVRLVCLSVCFLAGCQTPELHEIKTSLSDLGQQVGLPKATEPNRFFDEIPSSMQESVAERRQAALEHNLISSFVDQIEITENKQKEKGSFAKRAKAEAENKQQLRLASTPQELEKLVMRLNDTVPMKGKDVIYLERYIGQVVTRLMAAYPEEVLDPAPVFQIIDKNVYGAGVTQYSVISINTGALISIESEDELAAILAHEIAHKIMRHHNHQTWSDIVHKGVRVASAAAVAIWGKETDNKIAHFVIRGGRQLITDYYQNIIAYEYMREDEMEADLLAADMLYRAGYDWDAIKTVVRRVGNQSSGPALDKEARGYFFKSHAVTHPDVQIREENVSGYMQRQYRAKYINKPAPDRKSYYQSVFQGPGFRALERRYYLSKAFQAYDDKELGKAEQFVKLSLRGFPDDPDPNIRVLFYKIRKAQGNTGKAIRNLEIAAAGKQVTRRIFTLLIGEYENEERWTDAIKMLEHSRRRLGFEKESFYPEMIRYQVLANQDDQAADMIRQCGDTNAKSRAERISAGRCQLAFSEALIERNNRNTRAGQS